MRSPQLAFMIAVMILHSAVHNAQACPTTPKAGPGRRPSTARVERTKCQVTPGELSTIPQRG